MNCLVGINIALGHPENQSSLCSKVLTIEEICMQHKIQERRIEMACNNIKAFCSTVDLDYLASPRHNHFDLTIAICSHIKERSLEWKVCHVRGKQDQDPYKVLD